MMTATLSVLVMMPAVTLADRPVPPKKTPVVRFTPNVPVTITYAGDADPQLRVPKKFMVADAGLEGVPRADAAPGRTLFAGLALSAALVTGGLWFVRRSGSAAPKMLALFILSSVVTFTAFLPQVIGDAAPMPRPIKVEIDGNTAKTTLDVVIMPDGDRIELVLPSSLAPPKR